MKKIILAAVILSMSTAAYPGGTFSNNPKLQALQLCQETIKSISFDYNATTVPYAENYGGRGESYFAWNNRNPIKMPNKLGQLLTTSGSCIVDDASGKIISLTLNSKQIIGK